MATLTRTRSAPLLRNIFNYNNCPQQCVFVRQKQSKTKTAAKFQIESEFISLRMRGFLRPVKSYDPPEDASERLDKVLKAKGLSTNDRTSIKDLGQRFELFASCLDEFKYPIPNSELCYIKTVGDLRQFYQTKVDTTVPYDALANRKDLPPNLHIQKQYHRFHPDTDTLFKGKTAFPESSTLVTSIKYRKMYQGHKQYPKHYYVKE